MVKAKRKHSKAWLIQAALMEGARRNIGSRSVRHPYLWTACLFNHPTQSTIRAANDEVYDV